MSETVQAWKTPLTLIPDLFRLKRIRDASGNLRSWDEVYEENPNYEIYTDAKGKPLLNKETTEQDMNAPGINTLIGRTPAELFQRNFNYSLRNPANAYNTTRTLLGLQTAVAGTAAGLATTPFGTLMGITGDQLGQVIGDKTSNLLFTNPNKSFKLNVDTLLTPREAMRTGTGFVLGGLMGIDGSLVEPVFKRAYNNWNLSRALKNNGKFERELLPDKRIFEIGDIYTAKDPVTFLNLVPDDQLAQWVRRNMNNSLENAYIRGESGAYLRLSNLYNEYNVKKISPLLKQHVQRYLDAIFSKVHPNNLPNSTKFILHNRELNPSFSTFNIKPRSRAFGLNYSLGPLDNPEIVTTPTSNNNASTNIYTKQFIQGDDKLLTEPWIMSHEKIHGLITPYKSFEEVDPILAGSYFTDANNTELLARYLQLLNVGGAKQALPKMSPELFEWWKNNYVKLMRKAYPFKNETFKTTSEIAGIKLNSSNEPLRTIPLDNDMTRFFDIIPKRQVQNFINWASPQALKNGGSIRNNKLLVKNRN